MAFRDVRLVFLSNWVRGEVLARSFEESLKRLNNTLYECLRETVSNSPITTNYGELSFSTRRLANRSLLSTASGTTLTVSNVVLERSTIPFTASEESCVAQALNGINIAAGRDEPARLAYVLCITKRPDI